MTKEKGIPQIRFSGFTDTWEQRKLSDTLDFLSNNTLSRAELSEDTGTYKNVHYGDVLIKFGEYIDAQSTNLPYISDDEKAKKFESSKLQDGDIIIADTAEDEAVGKCAEIGNIGDLSIVSGLHTIPCRPKVKFAPAYLGFYLNSASYHDKLIPLMQGIKVTSISKSAISDTMISAPTNLSEQGKIGQFFIRLDRLITLHQRKYDKLTKVKKAMLEKMFPKNGSLYPEIRFKGFTDAWEQRELSEVTASFEYGLNAAAKEYDGKHKYIRITDIDDESREFSTEDITSPDTDFSLSDNYILRKGDILFARTGASVGKTYLYREKDGLIYFAGFLIRAKIKSKYDDVFVFQNTLTDNYNKYIRITSQRSGQPGVNAQEYGEYTFLLPKYEEQLRIGEWFTHLDRLITLHQRKLEKLKNIKKACLEKMFV